ncbi:MAG: AIR synthase-related protein [Ferruginibacter sp.]
MQQFVLTLVRQKLVSSAHDISEGGLFVSLLESAMPNNLGFEV